MFHLTLMKTSRWHVSVGAFGLGKLTVANRDGEMFTATNEEKRYLMRILSALKLHGVVISGNSPISNAVISDFSKSIQQRFRRQGEAGGFAYSLFFLTSTPEEVARQYIERFRSP